jgi:transcriptional regulator with GAF, ATPase, and Fis domain
LDLEESLQAILAELADTFGPDRMVIALLEQAGVSPTCLARFPVEETEVKLSRTMLQRLLQEKQTLITEDALADERFQRHGKPVKSVLEQQIRSAVCVPLQWGGEIRGILYLGSTGESQGIH